MRHQLYLVMQMTLLRTFYQAVLGLELDGIEVVFSSIRCLVINVLFSISSVVGDRSLEPTWNWSVTHLHWNWVDVLSSNRRITVLTNGVVKSSTFDSLFHHALSNFTKGPWAKIFHVLEIIWFIDFKSGWLDSQELRFRICFLYFWVFHVIFKFLIILIGLKHPIPFKLN